MVENAITVINYELSDSAQKIVEQVKRIWVENKIPYINQVRWRQEGSVLIAVAMSYNAHSLAQNAVRTVMKNMMAYEDLSHYRVELMINGVVI